MYRAAVLCLLTWIGTSYFGCLGPIRVDCGGRRENHQRHAGRHRGLVARHRTANPLLRQAAIRSLRATRATAAAAGAPIRRPKTTPPGDRSIAMPAGSDSDWNRVELEQRIYEPERGRFSWDNPEMRILYRILDWCEKNKADVFLQQMWGNVALEHVSRVARRSDAGASTAVRFRWRISARGWPRWSNTWSRRGLHLHPLGVHHQRARRRLVVVAEAAQQAMPLKPGLAAVRKALDAKGISIPLSGPDLTAACRRWIPSGSISSTCSGPIDFHTYSENFDWLSKRANGPMSTKTRPIGPPGPPDDKAFFMSEFGTMANGWGQTIPARAATFGAQGCGTGGAADQCRRGRIQSLEFHQPRRPRRAVAVHRTWDRRPRSCFSSTRRIPTPIISSACCRDSSPNTRPCSPARSTAARSSNGSEFCRGIAESRRKPHAGHRQ